MLPEFSGSDICSCCGREVTGLRREISMRMPDKAAGLDAEVRERRYSMDGQSFATLDDEWFMRALLPVKLTNGHEYHFGVWMTVDDSIVRQASLVWDTMDYAHLVINGTLANSVPPWGDALLNAPCRAVVRNLDELPYITSSSHPALTDVLRKSWPTHECEKLIETYWGAPDPAN